MISNENIREVNNRLKPLSLAVINQNCKEMETSSLALS